MNTAYKAHLEAKIQQWVNEHCEDMDFLWHPNIVRQMTDAAELVLDASIQAQQFGIDEQYHE
jgi:hypothetical protein